MMKEKGVAHSISKTFRSFARQPSLSFIPPALRDPMDVLFPPSTSLSLSLSNWHHLPRTGMRDIS